MLQQKLANLKDFILQHNPYFNAGFTDVVMDDAVGIINNGDKIIFPSDTMGNYFYLRVPNQVTFDYSRPIADNFLSTILNCDVILVAYMKEGNADILAGNLCTTIGRYQDVNTHFNKVIFQNDVVVLQELKLLSKKEQQAALQKLGKSVLVSIHFTVKSDFIFQQLNCLTLPCNQC